MSNFKIYTYPASNNWVKTKLGVFTSVEAVTTAVETISDDIEIISDDFKLLKSAGSIKVEGTETVSSRQLTEALAYSMLRQKYTVAA